MDHDLQVAAGECRCSLGDVVAPADEVELRMGGERLAQAVETVAGARHVDADAVSHY